MTDDQKREKPTLHEGLFIECLQKGNFQKIWEIINRSPTSPSCYLNTKCVTLSCGKSIHVKFIKGVSYREWNENEKEVLDLIIQCNYLLALQEYIKAKKTLSLDMAVIEGNKVMVELLLEAKADHFEGNAATLHLAAERCHAHLIAPLVQPLKTPSDKRAYQDFLSSDFGPWTALDLTILRAQFSSMKLIEECYSQIRSMKLPFNEEAGRKAIKAFFPMLLLPGTEAQPHFEVIEKLFQVGYRNPSLPDFFSSPGLLDKQHRLETPFRSSPGVSPPNEEDWTRKKLGLLFWNSGLKPHLVALIELNMRPHFWQDCIIEWGQGHHCSKLRREARSLTLTC